MRKQFGGKVTDGLKARYSQSGNWSSGKFQNLEKTTMDVSFQTMPKLLYKQFCEAKGRTPKQPLPMVPFAVADFLSGDRDLAFSWFGHSALLLRMGNTTLLIDPMLGPNASPIAPFATKRFSIDTIDVIDELPPLDAVLMTHDHYDHLDLASIERLKPLVKRWIVALGVGRHLQAWGISEADITELDWWDRACVAELELTFTPSRHFSGRGLRDRARSLWGGFVLKSPTQNVYWSGDGGYGDHFEEIGARFGPFQLGFMECGQYNEYWHQIHMYPEEAVAAALDAGVEVAVPVHWAGFALAMHPWEEPAERFVAEAQNQQLTYLTPRIGAVCTPSSTTDSWWCDCL